MAAVSEHGPTTRVDVLRVGPGTPRTATFLAPFDDIDHAHMRQRTRRVRRQRWQAALLGARAQAEHVDLPLAALNASIDLLPYQLEPLLAMRGGERRLLIADAVGLGKTIQAGLIVKELLRRGEAARVLIAAPSHLCPQWRDELRARFGLESLRADAATLSDLAAGLPRHLNPWLTGALWISSLDFLKQPHVIAALPPDPWDLVVIDEAHMVTGLSDRRAAAHAIAASARRVLLLTATPVSGGEAAPALRRIGALNGHDPLVVFRRTRADVGLPSHRRHRHLRVRPSEAERHALDLVDAYARAALATATDATADATQLLVAVFAKRALSTFDALALSATRRLVHLSTRAPAIDAPVQPSLHFDDVDDAALTATIGLPIAREQSWMRRLASAAAAAARASRKLSRLLTLLSRTREPVILFTEFRDSLTAVATALERRGHRVAIAHGGLAPAELQAALDMFRRGDARMLLATDVASQGLNLHERARWVVHVDVPWNPIRLEQRAGRVDRIGQRRRVHITQLVLTHARDLAFAARLAERADAAARHTAFVSDTRWRRRARAVAAQLERRRRWSRAWRGPLARGRPLAAPGGHDVWAHDIGGAETLIRRGTSAAAVPRARVRRATRITVARARRAAIVERALRAQLGGGETQPSLPGARAAGDLQCTARGAEARSAARDACDRRVRALDDAAAITALTVTSRRLFAGE